METLLWGKDLKSKCGLTFLPEAQQWCMRSTISFEKLSSNYSCTRQVAQVKIWLQRLTNSYTLRSWSHSVCSVVVKTAGLIITIRWKVVAPSQEIGTYQTFHVLVYLVDSSGYSSFLRLKSFIKLNKSNNVVSFFPRHQLSLPRFSPYLRKMPKECSTIFSPKDRSNRLGKKSQWLIMTTIDLGPLL